MNWVPLLSYFNLFPTFPHLVLLLPTAISSPLLPPSSLPLSLSFLSFSLSLLSSLFSLPLASPLLPLSSLYSLSLSPSLPTPLLSSPLLPTPLLPPSPLLSSLPFLSSPGVFISLKPLRGSLDKVKDENPLLFRKFTAECLKMGFPEIIRPCKLPSSLPLAFHFMSAL